MLCLFITIALVFVAQQITPNDSFEGSPQTGTPPDGWGNCDDGYSTVDTQPGQFYNQLLPSHGDSYVSLVTRSVTSLAGTVETVFTELIMPIERGQCYLYQVDLTLSETFYGSTGFDSFYFDNPCVLQVIGFNGSCELPTTSELLWESGPVSNLNWETYTIEINAEFDSYTKLALRPMFYPASNLQNSALLMDHLRVAVINEWLIDEAGMLSLSGAPTNIQWYFNGDLVPNANGIEMPFMGSGFYSVTFTTEDGCTIRSEKETVIDFSPVTYFPNPTIGVVTMEYFSRLEGVAEAFVFNDIGQKVAEIRFNSVFGPNSVELDLSKYSRGVYFLWLSREEMDSEVFRVVKMD